MRSPLPAALLLLASAISFSLAADTVTATLLQNPKTTSTTLHSTTSSYKPTVVQATRVETGYPSAASASHLVDSAGGASGTDSGSFSLSKGGMIAIIVVVVGVAVFGITSIVLFVLAKHRQWNVRASIKRASRRLTGRDPGPKPSEIAARKKRSGIVAGSRSEKVDAVAKGGPGHKRGLVVVRDEERGPLDYGTPPPTTRREARGNTWAGRLWGNDWK